MYSELLHLYGDKDLITQVNEQIKEQFDVSTQIEWTTFPSGRVEGLIRIEGEPEAVRQAVSWGVVQKTR